MFTSTRTLYQPDNPKSDAQPNDALSCNPKVLFLAYTFPPARITSSVRNGNVAKYLARAGWHVTVVTLDPSLWRHSNEMEVAERALSAESIQTKTTGHSWRFLNPGILKCSNKGLSWFIGGVCRRAARYLEIDRSVGWVRHVKRACASMSNKDVDVIFATGSPFVSFEVAKQLSKRLGKPFVLDYRDPWTGNPHRSADKPRIIRKETALLRDCAALTIVSPSWGAAMQRRFSLGSKLHIITNGYDPEELSNITPYYFDHFAIVYAGGFYPPKRVITPLFAALKLLRDQSTDRDWRFHYYGKDDYHVKEEGRLAGLTDRIVLHGHVTREEVLAAVRGAGLSVVITSVDETDKAADDGIVPGKLFECLGMKSPTLVITPPGSDVATMAKTTKLLRCCSGTDCHAIASLVKASIENRLSDSADYDTYAWPTIALKLDKILRDVVGKKTRSGSAGSM